MVAIYIDDGVNPQMYYVLTDHLGSIRALTDGNGQIVEEYSFDSWGRRRDAETGQYVSSFSGLTDRGYTGHEHLDEFGLINMNGRMYDPVLGRMLSPDNYVQDVTGTQNYNRYSYCLNNPVAYTDPSGDFIWAIPFIGFSEGGIDIGLTVGVGIPGVSSAQVTIGHDFGSSNTYMSLGVTMSGFTASVGYGSQTGATAYVGAGLRFPIPGVGTNLTSAGIGWSESGGACFNAFGIYGNSSGMGFSPSVGYSHFIEYKPAEYSNKLLACNNCPQVNLPVVTITADRVKVANATVVSKPAGYSYYSVQYPRTARIAPFAITASTADGPFPIGEVIGTIALTIAYLKDISDPFPKPWFTDRPKNYIPEPPMGFPNGNPGNNDFFSILFKTGLAVGTAYGAYKYEQLSNRIFHDNIKMMRDKTYVKPPHIIKQK